MQLFEGQLRFGLHSGQQYSDYAGYLELWQTAESLGLDWASVFDHFQPIQEDPTGPCFEAFTLLSAMAAQTSRIRCGILVTAVTYRNPAVLAKMAATIDHVSGGRMELGIGAAWSDLEHSRFGLQFPPIGERLDRLDEATTLIRSLWTQEYTNFAGRHYQLTDAICAPKPLQQPSIPLWVGGNGERRTLRVVAARADGWNTFMLSDELYDHKLGVLRGHCEDVGRSHRDVRLSVVFRAILRDTLAEAEEELAARADEAGLEPAAFIDRLAGAGEMVVGTPEMCVERLERQRARGVGDFVLFERPPADRVTLELFARDVAGAMRRAG